MKKILITVAGLGLLFGLLWLGATAATRGHDSLDHDWESLAEFGDDDFWFVPREEPHQHKRQGQIDVSEKYRCLVMHGPHTMTMEDWNEFRLFINNFDQDLSKHVKQVRLTCQEYHLRN